MDMDIDKPLYASHWPASLKWSR